MSRSHYWSCSKFADWVRGTPKLGAGTAEQWDEWDRKAQGYSKVRYWLAEEGLDYVSNVVYLSLMLYIQSNTILTIVGLVVPIVLLHTQKTLSPVIGAMLVIAFSLVCLTSLLILLK
jgi:hypothetical protein